MEVHSYSEGYGTVYDSKRKKEHIVDSLGNITFESPHSISHVFKNRFILTSRESGYKTKSAIIGKKLFMIIKENRLFLIRTEFVL